MTLLLAAALLTNAIDVASALFNAQTGSVFQLEGKVGFPVKAGDCMLTLIDRSGITALRYDMRDHSRNHPKSGDIIRVCGRIEFFEDSSLITNCRDLTILAHERPVEPLDTDARTFWNAERNFQLIRMRGTVKETFWDEIDPIWFYFILNVDGEAVCVTLPVRGAKPDLLPRLADSEVTVTGICMPLTDGMRHFIGRTVLLSDPDDIRILRPAADPYSVPTVESLRNLDAHEIFRAGRRRAFGHVIARRGDNRILLRDTEGAIIRASLATPPAPAYGDFIEVSGFPETDFCLINLAGATWRPSAGPPFVESPATAWSATELLTDGEGRLKINARINGSTIRIRGTVLDLPASGVGLETLMLKSDGLIVPVDINAHHEMLKDITVGCTVEVTGICLVDTTSSWRPTSPFPHATGIVIILRGADDIRILARPSWWTPTRLLIVIGTLLAALVGIVIWNRVLNRLVERRSRQLFREQVAHADEKLKVGERTRLAVELHDSLSQTLTGVSFQIDAAEQARQKDPTQIKKFLDVARQTLKSCREELRNCLWDLRNNALEEADAEVAIRQTVEPQIGDATLSVDFRIPRQKLTDNTFHAILRIVRELSVNAVRHGAARSIAIEGREDGELLVLSVKDDGCGFAPDRHPGADEGHFGLLGVAERVESMGGTLKISSVRGSGSRIDISIPL